MVRNSQEMSEMWSVSSHRLPAQVSGQQCVSEPSNEGQIIAFGMVNIELFNYKI